MIEYKKILEYAVSHKASDIHINVGIPADCSSRY